MKKLLISIITVGTIAFLSSCGTTDTKPAPTISVKFPNQTATSLTVASGATVNMTIEYKTGEDFAKLEVTETVVGGASSTTEMKPQGGAAKFSNNQRIDYTTAVTVTSTFTFKVTDSKNASATSAPLEVKVNDAPTFDLTLANVALVLSSNWASAFASGSSGSFYSILTKTNGTSALADSDFKLFDKSPAASTASTVGDMVLSNAGAKNATKFAISTLGSDALPSAINAAPAPTLDEVSIVKGRQILFITAAGKRGVIIVDDLVDANREVGKTKNASLSVLVLK